MFPVPWRGSPLTSVEEFLTLAAWLGRRQLLNPRLAHSWLSLALNVVSKCRMAGAATDAVLTAFPERMTAVHQKCSLFQMYLIMLCGEINVQQMEK